MQLSLWIAHARKNMRRWTARANFLRSDSMRVTWCGTVWLYEGLLLMFHLHGVHRAPLRRATTPRPRGTTTRWSRCRCWSRCALCLSGHQAQPLSCQDRGCGASYSEACAQHLGGPGEVAGPGLYWRAQAPDHASCDVHGRRRQGSAQGVDTGMRSSELTGEKHNASSHRSLAVAERVLRCGCLFGTSMARDLQICTHLPDADCGGPWGDHR